MRAIRVHGFGGPEVLTLEDVDEPEPAEGQAVVGLEAIGVNMIDTKMRAGAYPGGLPFTPGTEGAGRVTATDPGVDGVSVGDLVGFAGPGGAYADAVRVPADRLVPVPDGVDAATAAAVLLQGMTAHYLVHSVCPLDAGDVVVVHAAAGGVGLLLTQLANRAGLQVIGTTSTPEKAERVRRAGASEVVIRSERALPDVVAERTDGRGARAVFDSIGRDTLAESLASVGRRGYLVVFGQASGAPEPISVRQLQEQRSAFLTRPGLVDYVATRDELLWRANDVLGLVAAGELDVHVHATYPLERAADAHRAIESGITTGKLLLVPGGGPS